ncbi:MAG: FecR family protein [Gammaproteobacteria bacterium]|nr:FecR family protein [Gammaproteobacteria bacterium]MBT8134128.1 FecR family protein [Gammaproteobacteria bacterium]NNJ50652.1 FecR domain-containing protein [Gammaproteobacteria bacterium]
MLKNKIVTFLLVSCIILQSSIVMAEQHDARGKVLKFDGDVEVVDANGEKRTIKENDEAVNEMDTIVTKDGASVIVQFDDGALSMLDEKSRLRVEKTSWFSYLGGKVYFTFKKVFGEPRQVKTRAATIGVRGTTFIISENDQNNGETVALKEGLLDVESTGPAFEIHKQKELDEFERFKMEQQAARAEMKDEFEQYKKQTMREFVEYRRNFTLRPNRVINLTGYRVDETAMTEANKADFEAFESKAEDILKNFRARSKGLSAH